MGIKRLNDCYWSFTLKMNTTSIVSINSVTFACCKLFSVKIFPWKYRRRCCFWVVHLPVAKQRIFICNILTLSFFMLPINLWTFWWKPRDCVTHGCKFWCIKLCAFFLEHPVCRIVWLTDDEKIWRYVYSFRQNIRTWQTDGRTDRQTLHDGIGRAYA